MLANVLSGFKTSHSNDDGSIKRKHERRGGDRCVCLLSNMPYPVEDWSMGGVRLTADSRVFTVGQSVDLTMKFKIRGEMINIPVTGTVVRRTSNGIAVKYDASAENVKHAFQNIISDVITMQFADSQSNFAR